jgi:nitrate/TMAO reductase-like tetraheme cytochrome c subunit
MSLKRVLSFIAFGLLLGFPSWGLAQQPTKNPHGQIDVACRSCHSATSWKPIRGTPDFDHNLQTRFPLRGLHAGLSCTSCHVKPVFSEVGTNCASCHADIHRRQFGTSCEDCHTVRGWKVDVQSVRQHTNRFPLVGAHAAANCESCHRGAASGAFAGLSTACISCHQADYQAARTVDHKASNFSTACESCHGMTTWRGARFDHNTATRFQLTGAHASVSCTSCHVGGRFAGTSTDCFGCHSRDFDATTNPNHKSSGFPTNCESCHNSTQWLGASFDHSRSRFPLTGAHTSVACQQCHVGGRLAGTVQECVGCHATQYQSTSSPNHLAAGFSQQCASCHTTSTWKGAQFDHNATRFPLSGRHTNVTCSSCHVNNVFAGTSATCVSCHLKDYDATTVPNHRAGAFPQDCTMCHTTSGWQGAVFDHSKTRFALTGAHTTATCASCHVGGRFAGTPQTCVSCHLTNFNATQNPNHLAAGFPQTCETCHTTTQWPGARFDHNTATRFTLVGAHVSVSCSSCHVNNRFAGTPQTCDGCHAANYNSTTNPNHAAAGFPRDCTLCHSSVAWQGATFDHSRTRFPLTGAHTTTACATCHVNGQYTGLNTTCVGCHLNRFVATTNPNHVAAGFPQDCQLCHTTTVWTGATFDHSRTRFALTGAHTTTACASCHVGGRYAGTPMDCYSCHSSVYNSVANPNHLAAGFPKTCESCHTTTRWSGATFTHRFPIYSGSHAGKWNTCADCHTNSSNYSVFSCTTCHAHDKTTMDSKHIGVRNYVYDSLSCYGCHPQGRH